MCATRVLNDGAHSYTWDADGNSITVDGVGVTYDATDRAVEQNRSGSYTQIVYGPGGDKLALMNAQSLVKAFVPLSGGATAVYTSAGLDHYRHSDWLGSNRLSSTPSRTVQWSGAYAPWGEVYASYPSASADPSFTGQNSDTSTTGEYDFLYRQYGTQGRWPTPDPSGLAAASPSNPQSWNRYAYVLNNPLRAIDSKGLDCVYYFSSQGGAGGAGYAGAPYTPGGDIVTKPGDCGEDDNGLFVDGTVTNASVDSSGNLTYDFTPADCPPGAGCAATGTVNGFASWDWHTVTIALYSGAAGFGHVGIGLDSDPTVGFYPADLTVPTLYGFSVNTYYAAPIVSQGIVQQDVQKHFRERQTYSITNAQYSAIKEYIDKRTASPGIYNLLVQNCATFVHDALAAGGIPSNTHPFPADFYGYLKAPGSDQTGLLSLH